MTYVDRAHIGRFVSLLLLAATPAVLRAQTITGRVLDASGGAPVAGAEVRLTGAADRPATVSVTDSTGSFRLQAPAGRSSLSVRHVAYAPFTSAPLEVSAGQTLVVEVRVGRDVIPLEPLVVTARTSSTDRLAGFRERVALNAFGKFLTRDDIDRRPNANVSDLLVNVPSLRVVPVKRNANPSGMTTYAIMMRGSGNEAAPEGADVSMAGLCAPAIFLDGSRIVQSSTFPIDDLVRSHTLEGIEVYTSFTSVPIEYQTMGDCGALLLWTRQEPGRTKSHWLRNALGIAALGVFVVLTL